jgi:pantoate--beta-alanine ligase
MKVIQSVKEMQKLADKIRSRNKTIGFVPTMGFLHEGHLSLIKKAKQENSFVVVSIFVNPTQFGKGEDLTKYPKDVKHDLELCKKEKVDFIFYPSEEEIYPKLQLTWVNVDKITKDLCGKTRPTHFKGVTTIVAKLFNIVKPTKAYFGQKDYQQSLIIRKMVLDLNFDTKIIVLPTVREQDGLAMSSRNKYLNEKQRKEALVLFKSLEKAKWLIKQGERRASAIKHEIKRMIKETSGEIDYIEIRNSNNLDNVDVLKGKILIALAVKFGKARLIDNKVINVI